MGVANLTKEMQRTLRSKFGDAVEPYESSDVYVFMSRLKDWQPWGGGIEIISDGPDCCECTAGYIVENTHDGRKGLITAAHCVSGLFATASNPLSDDTSGVGSVEIWQFGTNSHDVAMFTGSTYTPWTYTGSRFSQTGEPIRSNQLAVVGDVLCTNGSATGEVCNAKVTATNRCFTASFDGTNHTVCNASRIASNNNTVLATDGDSGGAVIKHVSNGVNIGGHMSAMEIGGKAVWYVPVDKVLINLSFARWRMAVTP